MTDVFSVFGILDNGKRTVERFHPSLRAAGFNPVAFKTPITFLLGVRLFNEKRAKKLASAATEGSACVAHSNGCKLAQLASLQGAFSQLIFLNPALDVDAPIGKQVKRVHVFYCPTDIPGFIAGLFPFHPWGWAGREGMRGDERITNHNMFSDYPGHRIYGHLDIFQSRNVEFYGPLIANLLKENNHV